MARPKPSELSEADIAALSDEEVPERLKAGDYRESQDRAWQERINQLQGRAYEEAMHCMLSKQREQKPTGYHF